MSKIQKSVQENAERGKHEDPGEAYNFPTPLHRGPWLVIFSHGEHQELHTFVSLSEEKVYVREQEGMCESSCFACCGGWLFMIDSHHKGCFLLKLLSMEKIMLPPLPDGDDIAGAVITSAVTEGSSMILSFRRDEHVFLLHRLKEDKWEEVEYDGEDGIYSLLNYNGTIYALTEQGDLAIVDVVPYPSLTPLHVEPPMLPLDMVVLHYLLESCGELFLIRQYMFAETEKLHSFGVYGMDFSNMRWVGVSSLGDRAFFMGITYAGAMSCSGSTAGIEANCIYFVDSYRSGIFKFDMADSSVSTVFSFSDVHKSWTDAAWINTLGS